MNVYMVETIRIDEETVALLKQLKGSRSYNDVIKEMLRSQAKPGELSFAVMRQLEKKYAGRKKENVSEHIDEILYGKAR